MSDNEEIQIYYPTHKLGAVTRVKNEVENYCSENPKPDPGELIKFKEKLVSKIDNFEKACETERVKDADELVKDEFEKWYKVKHNSNELILKKLEILILENNEDHEAEDDCEDDDEEDDNDYEDDSEDDENEDDSGDEGDYKSKKGGRRSKLADRKDSNSMTEVLREVFKFQQLSQLPKNEPLKFNGDDITLFKSFMLTFKTLIESKCTSYQDKFYFLLNYTEGEPRSLVSSCLCSNYKKSYKTAVELLQQRYGNDYCIAQKYLDELENWPVIKSEDAAELSKFSTYLITIDNMMKNCTSLNQLNSLKEIKSLVMKLPFSMRSQFRSEVGKLLSENKSVSFKLLVRFVKKQSDLLNIPLLGDISDNKKKDIFPKFMKSKTYATNAENIVERKPSNRYCSLCNKDNHDLNYCFYFKAKPYKQKKEFLLCNKICFACLRSSDHQSKNCTYKPLCKICKKDHNTALHRDDAGKTENDYKSLCMKTENNLKISCPVVPVILKNPKNGKCLHTYMALDSFSTSSYMDLSIVKDLDLDGKRKKMSITTIEETSVNIEAFTVDNLQVLSLDKKVSRYMHNVNAKERWHFSADDAPTKDDVKDIAAFKDVPFNFIRSSVGILIGMNEPEILQPQQIVKSTKYGPYASKHIFGWAINGPTKGSRSSSHSCFKTKINNIEELDAKFDKVFCSDFLEADGKRCYSVDEKLWLSFVENNTKKLPNNQFEIKLPLKEVKSMPNNYLQVHKRAKSLEAKLKKDDDLMHDYCDFMNVMMEKKFVERVPETELNSSENTWFLTHHGVRHKQKGKLRVVFDCSLPYKGVSLNSVLWKGPDLANSSVGVLLRFRLNPIAVSADIEKMYYNIKLPIEDRNYLKFLWFENNDLDTEPIQFRMTVHLFGATTSSSVANFALKKSVGSAEFESVKNIINDSFYVDDMIASFKSEEEAVNTINEVQQTLQDSSFNLTSFSSNSRKVLKSIPDEKLSKQVHGIFQDNGELPTERALGIAWNTERDTIGYSVQLPDHPPTKRGILSTIFSIYDPLFLASPAFIRAKRIFQICCFYKYDWDADLPDHIKYMWCEWKKEIIKLNDFEIPRCYSIKIGDVVHSELHLFADGSEVAYGAVAYLRLKDSHNNTAVSIVMSKVRLTPLNRAALKTIPRIELNAAKIAAEMYGKLKQEFSQYLELNEVTFWTDSLITLQYIRSETANLHRFVANRVALIRNITNVKSWKFIPGKYNPADILSRGVHRVDELIDNKLWVEGPEFLRKESDSWPNDVKVPDVSSDDPEVKRKEKVLSTKVEPENPLEKLMSSTSNLFKLKCRVAVMLKYKSHLMKKHSESRGISASDLQQAENEIFKYVQTTELREAYNLIKSNKMLPYKHVLKKLTPFLGDDKLIRVGGRLTNAPVSYNIKHPIILHGSSNIVKMLIKDVHCKLGHMGKEYLLAELREKYHIVKVNKILKRILNDCIICRKIQSKPCSQKMAELPEDRVKGDENPFSNTATDLFGPFYVSRGRGKVQEKRYGVVFSCLSSRAIHLEITPSLDTDSYINALRRFISRRGIPKLIRSDNGTNMTAADKELKAAINELNRCEVEDFCKHRQIEWRFQPPYASHFGGSHERQIRTIRKILNSMLKEFNNLVKLTDDILQTLFCEIENILNHRPLSVVTTDYDTNQPLTPNHLLRLQTEVEFPPGVFDKDDIYSKRRWRQAQYLADVFWNRWRREYLHLLNSRSKWIERKKSLKVGDIVLVVDELSQRNHWIIGKISKVKCDENMDVRSAYIIVGNKFMKDFKKREIYRPINKLVLIAEIESSQI